MLTEKVVNEIIGEMSEVLDGNQLEFLKNVLNEKVYNQEESTGLIVAEYDRYKLLKIFIASKKMEGCTEETLKAYSREVKKLLDYFENKKVEDITTNDIRFYIMSYQQSRNIKKTSLDNMRRYYSTFFSWLESEDYIQKSPMRKIKVIKSEKTIKNPLSDEELEILKNNTTHIRDIAIIEFLYSTGVRVSELTRLNISDIDFLNKECIVFGKGQKERTVFLTEKAIYYLKKYLRSRKDKNPALFVHKKSPHNRLNKCGVECCIRSIGRKCNVEVHPHKFRRTIATKVLNRGMPIQDVKEMLGHEQIGTTMIYCKVSKEEVKYAHQKYA